jgi:hypothetical protein
MVVDIVDMFGDTGISISRDHQGGLVRWCVGSCGGTRGPRRTACCWWRQEGVYGVRGGVRIIESNREN